MPKDMDIILIRAINTRIRDMVCNTDTMEVLLPIHPMEVRTEGMETHIVLVLWIVRCSVLISHVLDIYLLDIWGAVSVDVMCNTDTMEVLLPIPPVGYPAAEALRLQAAMDSVED